VNPWQPSNTLSQEKKEPLEDEKNGIAGMGGKRKKSLPWTNKKRTHSCNKEGLRKPSANQEGHRTPKVHHLVTGSRGGRPQNKVLKGLRGGPRIGVGNSALKNFPTRRLQKGKKKKERKEKKNGWGERGERG